MLTDVSSADMWYLPPAVCCFFLLLIPAWVIVARRSVTIREVLKSGWHPVILAMSISRLAHLWHRLLPRQWLLNIYTSPFPSLVHAECRLFSSLGGLILDKTVSNPNYQGMAVFTPVINGEWRLIKTSINVMLLKLWIVLVLHIYIILPTIIIL